VGTPDTIEGLRSLARGQSISEAEAAGALAGRAIIAEVFAKYAPRPLSRDESTIKIEAVWQNCPDGWPVKGGVVSGVHVWPDLGVHRGYPNFQSAPEWRAGILADVSQRRVVMNMVCRQPSVQ
jgi:hypothetical protein